MTKALAIVAAVAIISALVLIIADWKEKSEVFSQELNRARQELASLRAEFKALSRAKEDSNFRTRDGGYCENVKKFEHQLGDLAERIDGLSREVDDLRQAEPNRPMQSVEHPSDVVSKLKVKDHTEDRLTRLDEDFRRQAVDAQWARSAAASLKSVMRQVTEADPDLKTSVSGVECRSSLCRVELADHDPASSQTFEISLMSNIAHIAHQTISQQVVEQDGRTRTVLFLIRPQHESPRSRPQ